MVEKSIYCAIINVNMKNKCGSTAKQEIFLFSGAFFSFVLGKGGAHINNNVKAAIVLAIVAVILLASGIMQVKGEM